jgi:hypothetical protein
MSVTTRPMLDGMVLLCCGAAAGHHLFPNQVAQRKLRLGAAANQPSPTRLEVRPSTFHFISTFAPIASDY